MRERLICREPNIITTDTTAAHRRQAQLPRYHAMTRAAAIRRLGLPNDKYCLFPLYLAL